MPGLLLFLGLGMLLGSEGVGGIEFDNYELAQTLGTIGLILILFEGGLTAGWGEIRPVLGTAVSLATIGTVITAVITGFVAVWLFDLSTLEGLLIGAAVAATDSAAIFAVLRGSHLSKPLARALEGESGMNDPVALLLVTGFIEWIQDPATGSPTWLAASSSSSRSGSPSGSRSATAPAGAFATSICPIPASTRSPRSRPSPSPTACPSSSTAPGFCPSTSPR